MTAAGHGSGHGDRLGLRGRGPVKAITDLGILEPDPETCELSDEEPAVLREPKARG